MILPFVTGLSFFLIPAGFAMAESGADPHLGPKEAQELMRENAGNPQFVVLDVRTPGEFSQGHLEGAVLVDYRSPRFREEMAARERGNTYLVYCRTGNRSAGALGIMKELGFRSYYHLDGGIKRWTEEGLSTVR
jgi:rhodanese-related sulfurtransferase